MRTKTKLSFFDVPNPVIEAVQKYCDGEIDDIILYEQANGVAAYYMLEFDQDMSTREKQLHLLPNGTIVTAF